MNQVFSDRACRFLSGIEEGIRAMLPEGVARRVVELVGENEVWRQQQCLNLTPSENVPSRTARRLLDSDLATRLTEGVVGDKDYPAAPQNRYTDEIEGLLVVMAKQLFGASFVEWRPVSNSMANALVFFALTRPGDLILTQSVEGGGNYSYQRDAAPAIAGLSVESIPHAGNYFEIDLDALRGLARRRRPKLIVVGGSYMLFELPVASLSEIARESGALLVYDAAHVSLLVSMGEMRNPLEDGAEVMTLSTHKLMGGPVGGMVLCNDPDIAAPIMSLTFPTFMQTRDLNKYAAAAHAFAEMRAFGAAYARQVVVNARALASALAGQGLAPIAPERGYTETHQLVIDLSEYCARTFTERCRRANILMSAERLTGDLRGYPRGTRISTQEITRRGMKEQEMGKVASLIRRAAVDCEPPETVAASVHELADRFQNVMYSFDADLGGAQ